MKARIPAGQQTYHVDPSGISPRNLPGEYPVGGAPRDGALVR